MLDINGGCAGLRPLVPGMSIFGPAYTLQFEEVEGEPAPAADYIDDVEPGAVVVLANAGRTYCTVWGDLLTIVAQRRGVEGTVIDGCCRDAASIVRLGYPLFARSTYMKSGKNRVRLTARNVRVHLVGQAVDPGDLIRGDDNGIIVVPEARIEEVAELCRRIEAMEAEILSDVTAGIPLRDARQRRGYNQFALGGSRAHASSS